jgi:hypothetical protein
MPNNDRWRSRLTICYFLCLALCAVFILLGFLGDTGWWGINHLAFFPLPIRLIFAAVMALILILHATRVWQAIADRLNRPAKFVGVAFLIICPVLFWFFRVGVHSLGDGYLRAWEIEQGMLFQATEMLDFLIHAVIYRVLKTIVAVDGTTAMAATSIAAGAAFIYMLTVLSPFRGVKKALFIIAVLSLGCTQFFFGYVESYTLLYLFSVWYMLLAFRTADTGAGMAMVTVTYLLAGFSHLAAVILAPSYIYVAWLISRHSPRRPWLIPISIIITVIPFVAAIVLSQLLAPERAMASGGFLLPLFSGAYAAFSPVHFFDILNEILLVAPIGLVLSPFLIGGFGNGGKRALTLLLLIPAAAFILLFDPKLTLIRDWDLFAVPVAVGLIPLFLTSVAAFDKVSPAVVRRAIPAALCAAVVVSSWIALNHTAAAHLNRAEYVLERSAKGRAYGCESLAHYYHSCGEYVDEIRILKKISPADRTARVHGKLAQAYYLLGRLDEAYKEAQLGVTDSIPNKLNAIVAGQTAFDKGEYSRAAFYLRVVIAMDPNDYVWLPVLGDALMALDSLDEAVWVYTQALEHDRSYSRAYLGLADIYYRKGDYSKAGEYCRQGLACDPDSPVGRTMWEVIRQRLR